MIHSCLMYIRTNVAIYTVSTYVLIAYIHTYIHTTYVHTYVFKYVHMYVFKDVRTYLNLFYVRMYVLHSSSELYYNFTISQHY